MQLSILLEFMGEVACLFTLSFNLGEEGNYCIRVYYLSFIQHKSPETICMPEVTIRSWFDTKVIFRDLESVYSKSFTIGHKLIRGQVLMLDGWEVCLYAIIPSLFVQLAGEKNCKRNRDFWPLAICCKACAPSVGTSKITFNFDYRIGSVIVSWRSTSASHKNCHFRFKSWNWDAKVMKVKEYKISSSLSNHIGLRNYVLHLNL